MVTELVSFWISLNQQLTYTVSPAQADECSGKAEIQK